MKKYLTTLLLIMLSLGLSFGQSKVSYKDIKGEWKLIIDIDEDEIEDETEDEGVFTRIIARSVSDFVINIIDEIDIRFEFQRDNRLRIEVNVFDEREIEYSEWHINSNGELYIDDDDHDDEFWLMKGKKLVAYEYRFGKLKQRDVYMERVN